MSPPTALAALRLALPKGRMQDNILSLFQDAGVSIRLGARTSRPSISLPSVDVKVLKPRNVVEMLDIGSRDLGFAGADLVSEHSAELVEVLDTGLDPVRIVAAAPSALLSAGMSGTRSSMISSCPSSKFCCCKGLDGVDVLHFYRWSCHYSKVFVALFPFHRFQLSYSCIVRSGVYGHH